MFVQLPMYQRVGKTAFKKDLTNIIALCDYLNNPQVRFPSVHIAGTNGKGSTANLLAAFFSKRGLKTGLYTSPHYLDFRERIKIDGRVIPEKEVVAFVANNQAFFEKLKPSFFEISVAMAFDYFAKEAVDIAIIETGLGGRLDSTNVINPLLGIITNISFDHQQFLGDSMPQIAAEKAGIIKSGVPIIVGETQDEIKDVFIQKARESHVPIYFADKTYRAEFLEGNSTQSIYRVLKKGEIFIEKLCLDMPGSFQQKNLVTCLKAIDILDAHHSFLRPQEKIGVPEGLACLKSYSNFMGRWQQLGKNPVIICDSAHNVAGISLIMNDLEGLKYEQLHIVLGIVKDKDAAIILSLFPQRARYYFAKAAIPRGLDAKILQQKASEFGLNGSIYPSVKKALEAAKKSADPNDLIFVGGSTFVVAEVV